MKNDGGFAFPHWDVDENNAHETHHGISIRDYFAALAMQAYIAQGQVKTDSIPICAYGIADGMIHEREK
jgi:hypothetical protein